MATLWSVAALLIGTHGSGANVETVNKWEGTPLHEACNNERSHRNHRTTYCSWSTAPTPSRRTRVAERRWMTVDGRRTYVLAARAAAMAAVGAADAARPLPPRPCKKIIYPHI